MFLQAGVARPHIAAGKLKVLATASAKRISVMPDVPTLAESGLPGFEVQPWFGIVVPAGTPLGIVKLLNAEIGSALSHPEARKKLAESGAEFVPNSPADFASFLHAEIGRFGKIVKASGANVE